jgi:hypothetical protein
MRSSNETTALTWSSSYVCGFFAGAANVLAGYPFDTVKVRQTALPRSAVTIDTHLQPCDIYKTF